MMANYHPFGNGAVLKYPHDTASDLLASFVAKSPVSMSGNVALPLPTFVGFSPVNLLPESLFVIASVCSGMTYNESTRFADNMPMKSRTLGRNLGLLSATTFAITVWNFIIHGVTSHSHYSIGGTGTSNCLLAVTLCH